MGVGTALRRWAGLEAKSGQALSIADGKMARLWGRVLGLGDVYAGRTVSVDAALQLSAVWACVRLTAETVGTLPFNLYREERGGGRSVASDHPLHALLHDAPNADMTAVEFWEGVVASLCLAGNAVAEKVRRGDGTLIALEPMRWDLVAIRRNAYGAREYRYSDPVTRTVRVLAEDDVFHVRGFGNGGDAGLSPIAYARQSLGTAMAADEAAGRMYANGIRPSGVLEMAGKVPDDQRQQVRDNIVKPLAGSANAGGVFLLEGGMKFTPISLSPKDAEMATARRWHVEDICRWFGTPPILIGHASEGQTMWGTGVEQINLSWLTLGLRAYLKRIEASVKRSLIRPEDRASLSAEFVVEGLLRADSAARATFYAQMVQNGILDRDEVRDLENRARRGGNAGELTVQSNLMPLDRLGETASAAERTPDPSPVRQ